MQQKQSLPTPVIAAVIALAVVIIGYMGYRYVNPPDLKPVGAQGATLAPATVPIEQGKSGPAKPGAVTPAQAQ